MAPAGNGKKLVWVVAAYAALVAQAAPEVSCRSCDQPCCADRPGGDGAVATNAPEATGRSTCQRCAAARPPAEASQQPCRCQLHARHEQPLSPARSAVAAHAGGDAAAIPGDAPPIVPQVLGVSREYVAASLAVPIRPPRILFGVWRN